MSYRKNEQRYGARSSDHTRGYQASGIGKSWSDFQMNRERGWGLNWYRNRTEGKIGGVAAGLADAWRLEHWMVRLGFVAAFLFTGTLAFWVYVAGWVMLAPHRPEAELPEYESRSRYDARSSQRDFRGTRSGGTQAGRNAPYRYRASASSELSEASARIKAATARTERMEAYLTSRRYKLDQAFREL